MSVPEERTGEHVVEMHDVTKAFGSTIALDRLSFTVRAGAVTGFLGPNGAGKTTALRILLGLDHADAGTATVFGSPFRELPDPSRRVGALLDSSGFHPGRSGRQHLLVLADMADLDHGRVEHVLQDVSLAEAADRRVGGYSLGMRRRLGLASAMLGAPSLLVLDEPGNGLDPAGTRWLRESLRRFAHRGGSVLVSSHVLGDVAQMADDVIVIDRGRVVAQTSVTELTTEPVVVVRTRDRDRLHAALADAGAAIERTGEDGLDVTGSDQESVGLIAAEHQVPLIELTARRHTLEELFFTLTEHDDDDDQG